MSGLQGFIYQDKNFISDNATVTAATMPSERLARVYPIVKNGYGNVSVYGNYSGDLDAEYEVKIIDNNVTNSIVSTPQFSGAGTGNISSIVAASLPAQTIVVECVDTGTNSTYATVNIGGLVYKAKTIGNSGNLITITIKNDQMVFIPTNYTLISAVKSGEKSFTSPSMNFGAKPMQGEIIPEDAPRISFYDDNVNIYLHYKKYVSGKWEYKFIPELQWDYRQNSKIFYVNLGRTIIISNGSTTETYSNIKTVAELWSAIKNSSSLLTPLNSSLELQRYEDSYSVQELNFLSSAYYMPPFPKDGNSSYCDSLINLYVNPSTVTERISVECTDAETMGAEVWTVTGSVHGTIGTMLSGYTGSFDWLKCKIPQELGSVSTKAEWKMENELSTDLCFSFVLGSSPTTKSIILKYVKKATTEGVTCPTVTFEGEYLGLTEDIIDPGEGGGDECVSCTIPDTELWWKNYQSLNFEQCRAFGGSYCNVSSLYYEGSESQVVAKSPYVTPTFSEIDKVMKRVKTLFATDIPCDSLLSIWNRMTTFISSFSVMRTLLSDETISSNLTSAKAIQLVLNLFNSGTVSLDQIWYGGGWFRTPWGKSNFIPGIVGNFAYAYGYASFKENNYFVSTASKSLWREVMIDLAAAEVAWLGVQKKSVDPIYTDITEFYTISDSDYYWTVNGGEYLPYYSGTTYYSCKQNILDSTYSLTNEFGLFIGEPGDSGYEEGTTLTVNITVTNTVEKTYQKGDTMYLDIIGNEPLECSGGYSGNDMYKFSIQGSASSFPFYYLSRLLYNRYDNGSLAFSIYDGAIGFQVGDYFTFSIEGGNFIWRKDGGSWSSSLPILTTPQLLSDGISISFDEGAYPSFYIGDLYQILAMQEFTASNVKTISKNTYWRGTGNVIIDLGSNKSIDTIVIADHTITDSVIFTASKSSNFSSPTKTSTFTSSDPIVQIYAIPFEARYLRFSNSETDIKIGYLFAGTLTTLSLDADSITANRLYEYNRAEAAVEPFSLLKRARMKFNVAYASYILNSDFEILDSLINYSKTNNDMPFFFIPNLTFPSECYKVRIDSDNIEFSGEIDLNATTKADRIYNLSLPLITC